MYGCMSKPVPQLTKVWPRYDLYLTKTTRNIPVVVLTPVESDTRIAVAPSLGKQTSLLTSSPPRRQ
jgi:hypothetical protein